MPCSDPSPIKVQALLGPSPDEPSSGAEEPAQAATSDDDPDILEADASFDVPEEIRSDPGSLLSYILTRCYGSKVDDFAKAIEVSRQSVWIWRKPGKGVPGSKKTKLKRTIASRDAAFRLPNNATVDDLIRIEPERKTKKDKDKDEDKDGIQNLPLVDLLGRICSSERFGPGTLTTLKFMMARPVSNPYVFYRWAWSLGGVPRSYVSSFMIALMQLRIYELYGFDEENATAWESWASDAFALPPDPSDTAGTESIESEDQ